MKVEEIELKSMEGCDIGSVGEFRYLGTTTTRDGIGTREMKKRRVIAATAFQQMENIWRSGNITVRLKYRLYRALILTILLYNSECWTYREQDLKMLEVFHFSCLKKLTRQFRHVGKGDVDIVSKKVVFAIGDWPCIEAMIRDKRLRFVGHMVRAGLKHELKIKSGTPWYKMLLQDIKSVGLSWNEAEAAMLERNSWKKICVARLEQHVLQRSQRYGTGKYKLEVG